MEVVCPKRWKFRETTHDAHRKPAGIVQRAPSAKTSSFPSGTCPFPTDSDGGGRARQVKGGNQEASFEGLRPSKLSAAAISPNSRRSSHAPPAATWEPPLPALAALIPYNHESTPGQAIVARTRRAERRVRPLKSGTHAIRYPFSPVSFTPWIKVRWAKKNRITIGTVKTVAAAMSRFHATVCCPWKSCNPSAIVNRRGSVR